MNERTALQRERRPSGKAGPPLSEKDTSLLAAIVESSDDAIIGKSLDGVILSWNPAAERMFGYTAAEAVGNPMTFIFPPERLDEEPAILARIFRGERIEHFETVRLRKDGSRIDVSVTISPVRDADGRIVGASKIVRDITAQKQIREELVKHREHLEELVAERTAQLTMANREMEAFSASVSHDLRAPLHRIDGFAELLGRHAGAVLDEKGARLLSMIIRSAKEMGELIEDLLVFSRMGRVEMRDTTVEPAVLVAHVIGRLSQETNGRTIEWKMGPLPAVHADPAMVRLVFENLLANAVKYTRGREKAVIEVGGAVENGEVVFHVRDNGVGFDMQYAGRLFGVFQRLHRAEDFEGTGIGLANVRRIIARHGGRTWAEGEVEKGAVFYFSLPGSRLA